MFRRELGVLPTHGSQRKVFPRFGVCLDQTPPFPDLKRHVKSNPLLAGCSLETCEDCGQTKPASWDGTIRRHWWGAKHMDV